MTPVTIAGIPIGDGHPTRLCADIGTNHGGNLDLAMSLIRSAKQAGCDFVKGQKRCPELAVPEAEWNELRDTPWGKMPKLVYRHRVEFSQEQWTKLFDFAHSLGIVMFTSVWDIPSLECMERVISPCYKIPSARAHDTELIRAVAATRKPVIVSTGMSTMNEVDRAADNIWIGWGQRYGIPSGIRDPDWKSDAPGMIVLQCTSAYPARAEESNLRVIPHFRWRFCCPVGFSSHKIGIATCLLAVAVGAKLIERHISLDRRTKGSDHRMSSEPEDLARLVKEIRYTEACLGDGVKRVYDSEVPERKRLRGTT